MKPTWAAWSTAGLLGLVACSGTGREAGPAPAGAASAAPTAAPPSAPPAGALSRAAADSSTELYEQIQRLIGAASCRDVSQCRALPMGSKPCGGPEGYLAWSVVGTDAARLEALAQRYAQQRQERNQRSGLLSDCAIVPEPALRCVATEGAEGRCQAVPGRGGSPALVIRGGLAAASRRSV